MTRSTPAEYSGPAGQLLSSRYRLLVVAGATVTRTLLQAIALSGGPSDNANTRRVVVFRQIEGKRHAAGFDLKEIRQGNAEDPIVYANDIIVVDGSEARRTYGEFLRSVPLLALFFIY